MNQLNLIAVPNGVFTLEEALEDTLIKKAIQQLQSAEATETDKIKVFLTLYQMIDTLAQLHLKGFDMKQVNQSALEKNMKYAIDVGYDSIMKTFTNHQRKQIRQLVMKSPAH
ncbi:MAG: hypothetical protein LCH73_05125 [Proteobacteria bacterium]|jgi:hypothetical protein|nr:hypothetical protein [Pseudomonadota bacterium]